MPRTVCVCSRASAWKGQVPSTIVTVVAGLEAVVLQEVEHARVLPGQPGADVVRLSVQDGTDRFAGGLGLLQGLARSRPASSYRRSGRLTVTCFAERRYSLAGLPAPGPVRPLRRS